jgi:hypothetical protein
MKWLLNEPKESISKGGGCSLSDVSPSYFLARTTWIAPVFVKLKPTNAARASPEAKRSIDLFATRQRFVRSFVGLLAEHYSMSTRGFYILQ